MSKLACGSPKEYRPLFEKFLALGWHIWLSNNNHWRLRAPDGRDTLTISYTPSSTFVALQKMKSKLRRLGQVVK